MAAPRKTPQDHKKPEAETTAEAQLRFDEVDGSEHLKPLADVKASDQIRFTARLQDIISATGVELDEDGEVDEEQARAAFADMDLFAFADFIDWVSERYAVDADAFDKWSSGAGGQERTIELVLAYMAEMGKDAA